MNIPDLTPGALVALRDGERTRAIVKMAISRDTRAQRELLEARLLALAFTMPGRRKVGERALRIVSSDASPGAGANTPPDTANSPPDPDTLEAYVTGALTGERLAAFEDSVRGDPRAFAALVAFKDAYFGLGRKRGSTWSPPPSRRQELGTLTVRSYGGRMELSWDGAEPDRRRAALRVAMTPEIIDFRRPSGSVRFRAKRREILGSELQALLKLITEAAGDNQSFTRDLDRLQSEFIMAAESNDPDTVARLRRSIGELLEKMEQSRSMLSFVNFMLGGVDERLEAAAIELRDAEPPLAEVEIPTAAADLWFSADPRREGGLRLRIQPTSREAAEFTWIRPGVDFALLAPTPGRALPLSVIDGEAMLLISRPGAASQVIRVRADGARPDEDRPA